MESSARSTAWTIPTLISLRGPVTSTTFNKISLASQGSGLLHSAQRYIGNVLRQRVRGVPGMTYCLTMQTLGLRPIVGLVHHGSGPTSTNLLDPLFPEKLAEYALQVAQQFPHVLGLHPGQ